MSEIRVQILSDIKTAMKAKEMERLTTLRGLNSEIKNKEIAIRPNELVNNDVIAVLKKIAKQRKDSIDQYEKASRADLVDKEKVELTVIESYLPAQLSEDVTKDLIEKAFSSFDSPSMKDMGLIMKKVTELTQGNADNKLVSQIVRAKLG